MTREPSLATLKALAEAVDAWYGNPDAEEPGWCDESKQLFRQLVAYRAEIAPRLRTRAEVDAEIVAIIRERCLMASSSFSGDRTRWEHLQALCTEPTVPEAERCPQCLCVGHHEKPCNPERPPIGTDPNEVCPCPASARLIGYLRDLREIYNEEKCRGSVPSGRIAGILGRWLGGHP